MKQYGSLSKNMSIYNWMSWTTYKSKNQFQYLNQGWHYLVVCNGIPETMKIIKTAGGKSFR